jgi:hypothetical protein
MSIHRSAKSPSSTPQSLWPLSLVEGGYFSGGTTASISKGAAMFGLYPNPSLAWLRESKIRTCALEFQLSCDAAFGRASSDSIY